MTKCSPGISEQITFHNLTFNDSIISFAIVMAYSTNSPTESFGMMLFSTMARNSSYARLGRIDPDEVRGCSVEPRIAYEEIGHDSAFVFEWARNHVLRCGHAYRLDGNEGHERKPVLRCDGA